MEEPVALNKEAGTENEKTLANLSPAEEDPGKGFCKRRNPETLNTETKSMEEIS